MEQQQIDGLKEAVSNLSATTPSRPLTTAEVRTLFDGSWVTGSRRPAQREIILTTSLLTGLDQNEVTHLRDSWLSKRDGTLFIDIPPSAPCIAVENPPCTYCDSKSDEFVPALKSRRVPVGDERLAEKLQAYYGLYGPIGSGGYHVAQVLTNRCLSREAKSSVYRLTHGVALAAKGFAGEEIRRLMGYKRDGEYGTHRAALEFQRIADLDAFAGLDALGTGELRT